MSIKTKDLPKWQGEAAKIKAQDAKLGAFRKKKFSSLNPSQKDTLLELVAVRLGLVEE